MSKILPSLWYVTEAEDAAGFYVSVFPDSQITRVTDVPADTPSRPPGSVKIVEFELFRQPFIAISAGPLDSFNHAISFTVNCDDQAEIEHYWDALLAGGGKPEQCGWLKDRFGVCWQIVPAVLADMMADPDRSKAARVTASMLTMVKFDVAALRTAHQGRG